MRSLLLTIAALIAGVALGAEVRIPAKFSLMASAPGTRYDGEVVALHKPTSQLPGSHSNRLTPNTDQKALFRLSRNIPNGNLVNVMNGFRAAQADDGGDGLYRVVYFPSPGARKTQGYYKPVTCAIAPKSLELTCSSEIGSTFVGCHGQGFNIGWAIIADNQTSGNGVGACKPIQLFAVAET